MFDSLRKVEISDSGLKKKRSQLKIDDLKGMFDDDVPASDNQYGFKVSRGGKESEEKSSSFLKDSSKKI